MDTIEQKEMRLSRKSSWEKSFREVPVGARHQSYPCEVHSASGVLNPYSRHNGCDRYIAKTFKPNKVSAVRSIRKQSGITIPIVPVIQGRFFIGFSPQLG